MKSNTLLKSKALKQKSLAPKARLNGEPMLNPNAKLKEKATTCFKILKKTHRDAHIELNFKNPLELMVATILSAQCTDVRVNIVTQELFKKFKSPQDYLRRPLSELEKVIHSTGFFRQKAKSIRGAMEIIEREHEGKVPSDMDALTKLPGVGRKTANVIRGNGFGLPGMPVDTHVTRICNRLGLTKQTDAVKIESEMTALIPKKDWTMFSHVLIFHGRRICIARKPKCEECPVTQYCNYYKASKS